jgi:hypothetical protein
MADEEPQQQQPQQQQQPTEQQQQSQPTDDSAKTYLESTVTKVLHDALVELDAKRPSAPVKFLVDYLGERAERVDGEIAARANGSNGNA